MSTADKELADKHFRKLVELVKDANFSTCEIIPQANPKQIEVSQPSVPRNPSIIFAPTREFLEDESDQFNNVVKAGIQKAKRILKNPPSPELSLQGQIHLGHKGPFFEIRIQ